MSQRRSSVKGVPLEELNAGLDQLTEDFHLCYLFDEAVGGNKGACGSCCIASAGHLAHRYTAPLGKRGGLMKGLSNARKNRFLVVLTVGALMMALASYRQNLAFQSSTYDDVLRYDLLAAAGIQVDLLREPLNGWKLLSGRKRIELTGGGRILTCMDRHLLLRVPFATRQQPQTIGEALQLCTSLDRLEEPGTTATALGLVDKN